MSKFIIETGTAHGRGFSGLDVNGYLAKVLSWAKRPCVDGSTQTFTADAGTDVITCSSHGYVDGESVEVSSDTTLPSGLSASTEYYVIYVDADSFKLATRYAYAMAGTAINILDAGTGTHSVYAKGGGAGWYLRDDFSRCTDKTFATTDVNTSTEEITITAHGFAQDQIVRFTTTGSLPGGLSTGTNYYVIYIDENTIKLQTSYQGSHYATAVLNITSTGSGTHTITPYEYYIVICDTASPAVNDYNTGPNGNAPKYLKLSYIIGEAGYVRVSGYMWWDTSLHRGEGGFSGHRVATYDDADFAYDFRGGEECLGLFARLGSTWTYCIIDEWTGISTLIEPSTKVGVLQSPATAGSSVVLQLDTGQAANFTENKWYYIYDFLATSPPYSGVDHVKVTNVNLGSDQITIDAMEYSYNIGAVISPYAHRYITIGNNIPNSGSYTFNMQYSGTNCYFGAPYTSRYSDGVGVITVQGNVYHQSYYATGWPFIFDTGDPDDEGYYYCMKPVVRENTANNYTYRLISKNNVLGTINNMLISAAGNMAQMLDYRTMSGVDYLYYGNLTNGDTGSSGSIAWLIRNTESTT
jgi:hypothetical protein